MRTPAPAALSIASAALALLVAACGGGQTAASPSTTTPQAPSSAASAAVPSASSSAPVADEEPSASVASEDPTACLKVDYRFKREWENKGESFQSVWLLPNFTLRNDCDTTIKAVKFSFDFTDVFGDPWPHGYTFKSTVNLKPGKRWSQSRSNGYQHYDTDENFMPLTDANLSDLVPEVSDMVIVMADGTKVTSP